MQPLRGERERIPSSDGDDSSKTPGTQKTQLSPSKLEALQDSPAERLVVERARSASAEPLSERSLQSGRRASLATDTPAKSAMEPEKTIEDDLNDELDNYAKELINSGGYTPEQTEAELEELAADIFMKAVQNKELDILAFLKIYQARKFHFNVILTAFQDGKMNNAFLELFNPTILKAFKDGAFAPLSKAFEDGELDTVAFTKAFKDGHWDDATFLNAFKDGKLDVAALKKAVQDGQPPPQLTQDKVCISHSLLLFLFPS